MFCLYNVSVTEFKKNPSLRMVCVSVDVFCKVEFEIFLCGNGCRLDTL